VLGNSIISPLYLLCFAVGNLEGKDIALRIAHSLSHKLESPVAKAGVPFFFKQWGSTGLLIPCNATK
jgi:protein gp37